MKILVIAKKGESLTGAKTYEANLIRELSKAHQVEVFSSESDLDQEWDIAHCTDLKHLPISLPQRLKCPLVVDSHDYYWVRYFHFFCLDFPVRFLLQKIRKRKYLKLLQLVDGIILHGQYVYDQYDHPHKYLNFYYGLDYSAIEPRSWDEKENLILFVGGDYFRKGIHRLLRALPRVVSKVPNARLLVIGNDYWYVKLFARFLARGLPVEFIYGMPREELYRTYGRAKVFVMPSEIEAIPLVSSEATMAGVPPILSDAGGNPEIVLDGKTGFIVPLEDSQLLADRIVTCLTDRDLSDGLVRKGQEFLSQFTSERMMGRLEEIYRDVMAGIKGGGMTTVDFGASYGGKRVLVTGGLGFIGLNLVSHLLDLGAEVTVLDNFVPPSFETYRHRQRAQVKLAVADIRDADKVERVVRGKDVVFNLAGKSGAADSNKAPLLDLDINCRGHLTILEACREHNPHVSIVFPSSRLVYGKPHYLPVDEEHPLTPESIYAAHKVSVENYHLIYARLYGLTTSILRISNPYGPMQCVDERPYGIANRMIQAAVDKKQITLFGEGEQRRDYLYIDDLVDAFLRAGARREGPPLVCNIGDSRSVSLRELAELAVQTAGGGEIVQVPWPKEYQAIETGDYQSCIERAREVLGWEPVVPLAEGIAMTIAAC